MTCLMSGPPASWLKNPLFLPSRLGRRAVVMYLGVFGPCILADHRQMSAVLSTPSLTYWCHLSAWVNSCVAFNRSVEVQLRRMDLDAV